MSGGANLILSLMDRTQLPWEWEVGERGEGREPATPPLLLSFLSFFLFPLPSPGRLYCSCRWFLGIKLLLAASCLSSHTYSGAHTHTHRQILTSPTRACWQRPIYGHPIYCSLLSLSFFSSGFRLLSKSRHTELRSQPAPLLLLAHMLIPGQTATTAFTMAFDGAALLLHVVWRQGICTAESRHGLPFWEINLFSPPGTVA